MRSIEEIRKRCKWIKNHALGCYSAEIVISGRSASVVFSFEEDGWEHVSISFYNKKMPSWDDMCELKDIFWEDEEEVIQIHPKKTEYVNMQGNCLHLWRHKKFELPK